MSKMNAVNGILTYRGLEIKKSDIVNKYEMTGLKRILKKFIIRYKSPIGTFYIEKKNYQYLKDEDMFLFPRFASEDLLKCKIISEITNTIEDGKEVIFHYTGSPTYNQTVVIDYIFNNIYTEKKKIEGFSGLTLNMAAGCHIKDTGIIMYDGTIKMVQDIQKGDIIMGDDSTPRKVLKLVRGKEMMYKITNVKNESYIVNENHILSLIYTRKKNIIVKNNDSYMVRWFDNKLIKVRSKTFTYKNNNKNDILLLANDYLNSIQEDLKVDITVINYLKLSSSMQKLLCGYKSSVSFKNIDIPLDPYMIGFWLGDGNTNTSVITTQDSTIINYFRHNLIQYKCYLQYSGKSSEYCYRINGNGTGNVGCNYFLNTLRDLNLLDNKHIPHIYKCNSRENQLKLLAGILDADGNLCKGGGFEFTQSLEHERIIDDVIYLCRSLGFSCYKNIKKTSWTYKGVKNYGDAWRIQISGNRLEEIPTLCPRKKANPRKRNKNTLISGISVEKLEIDNYYGFQLDGNHRYLMDDFTTLHNCGKTYLAMNIIARLQTKTLIIVPNTYLLTQWFDLLTTFFPNNTIGQYYGKKKEDGDIVVAIINSLVNDEFIFDSKDTTCINCIAKAKYNFEDEESPLYCNKHKLKSMVKKKNNKIIYDHKEYFKEFGFVILDESHIYCTDAFKLVYTRFQSSYMLGLSATPDERTNKCDIISHLNVGKVLKADEIEGYRKDNVKFDATVTIVKYNAPDEYVNTHINESTNMVCVPKIIEDIINDEYRNKLIIDQLLELFHLKLNIFVFSERRSHLEHLYGLFNNMIKDNYENENYKDFLSIPESNINNNIVLYGNSSEDDVNMAKQNSNIIFTTFAYSSTGVSINRMTGLILASPRRSKSIQIIGRIFRLDKEKNHIHRHIIDIVDNKSVLKNQLYERKKAYADRECIIQKKEINYTDIFL